MEDSQLTKKKPDIKALFQLIKALRGKSGCPWDKKQTPRTLAIYLVEELYELTDAIETGTPDDVCEELGDVLFHILFLTEMYQEKNHFNFTDILKTVIEKMIRRHPHVFGHEKVKTAEKVKEQWHQIKKEEKNSILKTSVLDSIPKGIPSLIRAYRISERAARTGFDWEDLNGVLDKAEEEWAELKSEVKLQNQAASVLELGDVLFTLVNVARFMDVHPTIALNDATNKFEKRFRKMEKIALEKDQSLESLSTDELNRIWLEIKEKE